jgi:hypothetical protein
MEKFKFIKKQKTVNNTTKVYGFFVLKAGLEPARTNVHWILSPACLPIPPLEQLGFYSDNFKFLEKIN